MTLLLIESSLNLQITRKDINSQTSSILAKFRLLASELPVLEGPVDFGKCCTEDSDFIFD